MKRSHKINLELKEATLSILKTIYNETRSRRVKTITQYLSDVKPKPTNIVKAMRNEGYISKDMLGVYVWTASPPEMRDAIKVIRSARRISKQHCKAHYKRRKVSDTPVRAINRQPINEPKKLKPVKEKYTISLLWGLFKYTRS